MTSLILLITFLLDIYVYTIIAVILVNWMVLLGVMNTHNAIVQKLYHYLNLVTAPVFEKLRKVIPPIAGMDLSPLALLIGINIIKGMLYNLL